MLAVPAKWGSRCRDESQQDCNPMYLAYTSHVPPMYLNKPKN